MSRQISGRPAVRVSLPVTALGWALVLVLTGTTGGATAFGTDLPAPSGDSTPGPTSPAETTPETTPEPTPTPGPAPGPRTPTQPSPEPTGEPTDPSGGVVLDDPKPVYEDLSGTVTGRIDATGESEQVRLQRMTAGGWRPVVTATTEPDGSFSARVRFAHPREVTLRARYVPGAGEDPGEQTSNEVTLSVLDRRVVLHLAGRFVTFGSVLARGHVIPAIGGVRVRLQRWGARGWSAVGTTRTRPDGSWRARLPNRTPGAWRVRAMTTGRHPLHGTREVTIGHRYVVRAVLAPVVSRVTAAQLGGSWHQGCPVGPAQLRNVRLTFKTYGPTVHRGTLVVRTSIVDDVRTVWSRALADRFPFGKIFPTARYGGSDPKSMWHDNTSAFNCRHVTGDPTSMSPHSYGTAIDINTVRNPYLDSSGRWWPHARGARFRDRSEPHPGMLFRRSAVTRVLTARGFQWGGRWSHPDYQHFDPW